MCNLARKGSVVAYVDDTVFLFKGESWLEVYSNANKALKVLYNWLNVNLLTLNKTKTIYLAHAIDFRTNPFTYMSLKIHYSFCE